MEGSVINRETAHKIALEVNDPDVKKEMTSVDEAITTAARLGEFYIWLKISTKAAGLLRARGFEVVKHREEDLFIITW